MPELTTTTPDDLIQADRALIDEIDAEIVRLLRQRREVSRRIQDTRLASGGRRLEHNREVAVVNRYAESLGRPGTAVALAMLEICRGSGRS